MFCAPRAYTRFVSGSPATFDQPRRWNGRSVWYMFSTCVQSFSPVLASRQTRASWVLGPAVTVASACCSPTRVRAYTLPFITMGLDMPPMSLVQMRFLPWGFSLEGGAQSLGRFFWRETPFCSGPRQRYQSLGLGA